MCEFLEDWQYRGISGEVRARRLIWKAESECPQVVVERVNMWANGRLIIEVLCHQTGETQS